LSFSFRSCRLLRQPSLEELGDELSHAFGGYTVTAIQGRYRAAAGSILPDKINILCILAEAEEVLRPYANEQGHAVLPISARILSGAKG